MPHKPTPYPPKQCHTNLFHTHPNNATQTYSIPTQTMSHKPIPTIHKPHLNDVTQNPFPPPTQCHTRPIPIPGRCPGLLWKYKALHFDDRDWWQLLHTWLWNLLIISHSILSFLLGAMWTMSKDLFQSKFRNFQLWVHLSLLDLNCSWSFCQQNFKQNR